MTKMKTKIFVSLTMIGLLTYSILISTIPVAFAPPVVVTNGHTDRLEDDPQITVGANWYATSTDVPPAFYWSGGALPVASYSDPFTYTSNVVTHVKVTDDFCKGDVFEVYDNAASIGTTSNVPIGACTEVGPDAAYADPAYSSGCFERPPGSHSIEIETILGLTGGRGYIEVHEGPCPSDSVPELSLTLPLISSLAAIAIIPLRRLVVRRK